MKRNKFYILDKEDKKVVQILADLGMPKNLAKTLLYLSHVDECYSADIEHGTYLRQPEVSIALQKLRQKGWVKNWELKMKGKGRPVHIYKPTMHLFEILKIFEQEKLKEVESVERDISELKSLIESR